jgi:hypothetical protein
MIYTDNRPIYLLLYSNSPWGLLQSYSFTEYTQHEFWKFLKGSFIELEILSVIECHNCSTYRNIGYFLIVS